MATQPSARDLVKSNSAPKPSRAELDQQRWNLYQEHKQTILEVAKRLGVDPAYLVAVAQHESGFKKDQHVISNDKSQTAGGLFMFIDKTWNKMMLQHGMRFGLDPSTSKYDAYAATLMAAQSAKENTVYLKRELHRTPTPTELYTCHFLGPGNAAQFIKALEKNPQQSAADLFPKAAAANHSIFYIKDKATGQERPRSLQEIHNILDNIMTVEGAKYVADIKGVPVNTLTQPKPAPSAKEPELQNPVKSLTDTVRPPESSQEIVEATPPAAPDNTRIDPTQLSQAPSTPAEHDNHVQQMTI